MTSADVGFFYHRLRALKLVNMSTRKTNLLFARLILQSPTFLLVSMALSFLIIFSVEFLYYSEYIFAKKMPHPFNWLLGCAIGLMFQLARFAFGIAGAADFSNGNTRSGIAGMIFSVALAVVGAIEVHLITSNWAAGDEAFYFSSMLGLQSIVWLGLVIEIRIAMSVGNAAKEMAIEDAKKEAKLEAQKLKEEREWEAEQREIEVARKRAEEIERKRKAAADQKPQPNWA